MPIQAKGFDELARALFDMADHMQKVPKGVFDYVGKLAVDEMKELAPVDTGYLRDHIKLTSSSRFTAAIKSEAPYSQYVDQGHRTRSGSFVPANPFFSSVIGRIAGGELIKKAKVDMDGFIRATLSRYRAR